MSKREVRTWDSGVRSERLIGYVTEYPKGCFGWQDTTGNGSVRVFDHDHEAEADLVDQMSRPETDRDYGDGC